MIKVKHNINFNEKKIQIYEKSIKRIFINFEKEKLSGFEFFEWKNLPQQKDEKFFDKIHKNFKRLKKLNVDTLVVIGSEEAFLTAKAAIEVIDNQKKDGFMDLVFIGNTISSTEIVRKANELKNKNFAINAISQKGSNIEFSICFRIMRKLLETNIGRKNAKNYILITTNIHDSKLATIATKKGYTIFNYPKGITYYYTSLTIVSLLPLYFAGIDIKKIIKGALSVYQDFKEPNIEKNAIFKYSIARHYLSLKNNVEIISQFEPNLEKFSELWKNLAYFTNVKNEKGNIIISNVYPRDIKSYNNFFSNNKQFKIFATFINVLAPKNDLEIPADYNDLESINKLTNKTVHDLNEKAFKTCLDINNNFNNFKTIQIQIDDLNEFCFGELVYFLQLSFAINAYLNDLNPFSINKEANFYNDKLKNFINND